MTKEENGITKGLLIGIFGGVAVGAIIALLFAPKSGEKLREEIKTKSRDFTDDTARYISNAQKKVSQLINDTKDKAENYVQNGKVKVEKESERLKSAVNAGVNAYQNEKET